METKLKFSDIIRYILLGSLSLVALSQPVYILLQIVDKGFILQTEHLFTELLPMLEDNSSTYAMVAIVVLLAASYLMGAAAQGYRLFLLQSVRTGYQYAWVRKFVEYCFGNPTKQLKWLRNPRFTNFWRTLLRVSVLPSIYYDIYNYTRVLKFRKKSTLQIPEWIYISDEPQMISEVIDKLVGMRDEDDHLYLNEFLTSLAAVLWTFILLMVPLLFFMPGRTFITMIIYYVAEICFCIAAKSFGEEYIRSLGMWFRAKLEGERRMEEYGRIIALHGAPKVYLLVRTVSSKDFYLDKTLESIERQSYKNFQVIVIEDLGRPVSQKNDTNSQPSKAQQVVERYNDREKHPSLYNHITFCKLECGNPATTMMRERDFFLKMADRRDIAVILDDDDELRTDGALLDIVHAMTRNKANLCLSSFESKGDLGLDITNNGGGVHNNLIQKFSRESIREFDTNLCYASSIGWTKAYTAEVAKKYMNLLYNHERKNPDNSYCAFEKYEDFPDFVMLLLDGTVITGVREATHAYYKRPGRITTTPTDRDFSFCRARNLNLLIELVLQNPKEFPDAKKALEYTVEFVLFKTCQIEDIYHKHEDTRQSPVFSFTDMLYNALSKESRKALKVKEAKEFRSKVCEEMEKMERNNIFRPTYISLSQMEKEAKQAKEERKQPSTPTKK